MALPEVGQATLLSDLFACALLRYVPRSVAVLGCAGGNGFERIPSSVTRIVGVDINPTYVAAARSRFADHLPGLEVLVGDVQTHDVEFEPVELIFAGLLFEYVDLQPVLERIRSMLGPDGTLVTVVQLPSAAIPDITPSAFHSLEALSSTLFLVAPDALARAARARGYEQTDAYVVESIAAKKFQVQAFRLLTPADSL